MPEICPVGKGGDGYRDKAKVFGYGSFSRHWTRIISRTGYAFLTNQMTRFFFSRNSLWVLSTITVVMMNARMRNYLPKTLSLFCKFSFEHVDGIEAYHSFRFHQLYRSVQYQVESVEKSEGVEGNSHQGANYKVVHALCRNILLFVD